MDTGSIHRTTFRALNGKKYSASALASNFHPITSHEGPGQIQLYPFFNLGARLGSANATLLPP